MCVCVCVCVDKLSLHLGGVHGWQLHSSAGRSCASPSVVGSGSSFVSGFGSSSGSGCGSGGECMATGGEHGWQVQSSSFSCFVSVSVSKLATVIGSSSSNSTITGRREGLSPVAPAGAWAGSRWLSATWLGTLVSFCSVAASPRIKRMVSSASYLLAKPLCRTTARSTSAYPLRTIYTQRIHRHLHTKLYVQISHI